MSECYGKAEAHMTDGRCFWDLHRLCYSYFLYLSRICFGGRVCERLVIISSFAQVASFCSRLSSANQEADERHRHYDLEILRTGTCRRTATGLQVAYSKITVTRECMEIKRLSPGPVDRLPVGICRSEGREMINILMKYPCSAASPAGIS